MIGIVGFFALSMFAMAGALDGEIAMPAAPALIRSSTIRTSPVSSALDAGPVYTHLYSEFGFSLFHSSQPLPSTVKNGLSRPFTTTARVFFSALTGPPKTSTSTAALASMSIVFFIPLLRLVCESDCAVGARRPDAVNGRATTGRPYLSPRSRARGRAPWPRAPADTGAVARSARARDARPPCPANDIRGLPGGGHTRETRPSASDWTSG